MAAVRVCRAVDNHRELRRAGAGGAFAVRRQNGARSAAGEHRNLFSVHLLCGSVAEDPGARTGAAQKLLPQEHMEYYGLFRCNHRVSVSHKIIANAIRPYHAQNYRPHREGLNPRPHFGELSVRRETKYHTESATNTQSRKRSTFLNETDNRTKTETEQRPTVNFPTIMCACVLVYTVP